MMAISQKISEMMDRSSWIRKMFEEGSRLKKKYGDEKVCDFSLGNPNIDPPREFIETVVKILHKDIPGKHGYMPNAGLPTVRERIAEYLTGEQETRISGNHIILTCGAGGALNVVMKTIFNPGDMLLGSVPYFIEYRFYPDNHGGVFDSAPCRGDFELDIDALAGKITDKTAALIINSPNNPSGHIYSEKSLAALGEMLEKKSSRMGRTIYLISDEPYRKIVYDGNMVPPVFPFYKNSIVVSSYSKDLSIPGERIGFLAVNPDAEDAERLINGMILCNRILGFVNAPSLMQRTIQHLQGVSVDVHIYQHKRDLLCDGLAKLGYEFIRPKGTFYLLPKAPGGDDLGFVQILQEQLVLTVPGRGFGTPGYFRIAFCVDDGVIERSMKGFGRAIEAVREKR
jgi:aspartate aminotransferase